MRQEQKNFRQNTTFHCSQLSQERAGITSQELVRLLYDYWKVLKNWGFENLQSKNV